MKPGVWRLFSLAAAYLVLGNASAHADAFCDQRLTTIQAAIEKLTLAENWSAETWTDLDLIASSLPAMVNWSRAMNQTDCEKSAQRLTVDFYSNPVIGISLKNLAPATSAQSRLKQVLLQEGAARAPLALNQAVSEKIALLQAQVWGVNPFAGNALPGVPSQITKQGDVNPDWNWLTELMRRVPTEASRRWLYNTWSKRTSANHTTIASAVMQDKTEIAQKTGFKNWFEYQIARTDLGISANQVEELVSTTRATLEKGIQGFIRQTSQFAKAEQLTTTFGPQDLERAINFEQQAAFGRSERLISTFYLTDEYPQKLLSAWGQAFGFRVTPADSSELSYPVPTQARTFQLTDSKTEAALGKISIFLHDSGASQSKPRAFLYRGESYVTANLEQTIDAHFLDSLIHSLGLAVATTLTKTPYSTTGFAMPFSQRAQLVAAVLREWAFEPGVLAKTTALSSEQIEKFIVARDRRLPMKAATLIYNATLDHRIHTQAAVLRDSSKLTLLQDALFKNIFGVSLPPQTLQVFNRHEFWKTESSGLQWADLWIEMAAFDLITRFKPDRAFTPQIASRFRKALIEPGNTRPLKDQVNQFLGRPVSSAFWIHRVLQKSLEHD